MLKQMLQGLAAACLMVAGVPAGAAQAAENPFIGAWRLNTAKTRLPDEMKVEAKAGGKYAFDFGGAVETVAVDGTFQPGYGQTLLSVKAQAPDTWIVERQEDGRLQLRATWKLARDGKTLTDAFRQFDAKGPALSMDYVYRRAGPGAGFAGDWRSIKETMNSPYAVQVKAFQGQGLSFITPSQHSVKNLTLDGQDHPREGLPAALAASSSAKRVDARHLTITDKAGGKVFDTQDVGLSADLKTLTMTTHIPGRAEPNVMVFDPQ